MNLKDMELVVVALVDKVTTLETTISTCQAKVTELETTISGFKPRDRGPQSSRTMTDADARRIKFGDLKNATHKAAAKELGLSYGQIYSAREGYTFKDIKEAVIAA